MENLAVIKQSGIMAIVLTILAIGLWVWAFRVKTNLSYAGEGGPFFGRVARSITATAVSMGAAVFWLIYKVATLDANGELTNPLGLAGVFGALAAISLLGALVCASLMHHRGISVAWAFMFLASFFVNGFMAAHMLGWITAGFVGDILT